MVGCGLPETWVRNWAGLPSDTMTSRIGLKVGVTSCMSGAVKQKRNDLVIFSLDCQFWKCYIILASKLCTNTETMCITEQ